MALIFGAFYSIWKTTLKVVVLVKSIVKSIVKSFEYLIFKEPIVLDVLENVK